MSPPVLPQAPLVHPADSKRRACRVAGLVAGICLAAAGHANAAVVLDLIGNLNLYEFPDSLVSLPSQSYTDFAANNCTVVEDFTLVDVQTWLSEASVLMLAQNGFEGFSEVEGYHLNVYSNPFASNNQLQGDVLSLYLPASAAAVTKVLDPATGDEYGLVTLPVGRPLPGAGTYWLGISPQASYTVAGGFQVAPGNTTGTTNTAGIHNGIFYNPGGGFGIPGNVLQQDQDFALSVTVVPEPSATVCLVLTVSGLCFARRRSILH